MIRSAYKSRFVDVCLNLVSSRVTNITCDGSVAKPEHAQCSRFRSMAEVSFLPNLVPRAHVPFGQHQDTELWNNQQDRSQSPRVFCF